MMKRLLSILAIVAMLISVTLSTAFAATATTTNSPAPTGDGSTFRFTNWQYSGDYSQVLIGNKIYDNYTFLYRYPGGDYYFNNMSVMYLMDPMQQGNESPEDAFARIKKNLERNIVSLARNYPKNELVEISGKPWQDTEFAQLYLDNVPAEHRETAKNKANNHYNTEIVANGMDPAVAKSMPIENRTVYTHTYNLYRSYAEFKKDGAKWDSQVSQTLTKRTLKELWSIMKPDEKLTPPPSDAKLPDPEPAPTFEITPPESQPTPVEKEFHTTMVALTLNSPEMVIYRDMGTKGSGSTQQVTLDTTPVAPNGYTLIPARALFEAMGANVEWFAETSRVRVTDDKLEIILTLGSDMATITTTVDGESKNVQMQEKATTINGRTVIPLRFVSEALGYDVRWYDDTQRITVTHTIVTTKETPKR